MQWTLEQVAAALGTVPPSGVAPLARLAGVSIDSRTVRPGELFLAIHGPRHDGHAFVAAALASGALAGVVERARLAEFPENVREKCFAVAGTLDALQRFARVVRRDWGRQMAAVTGSAGKTTTKEILAALVGTRRRVLRTSGNQNNEYGLPLTLLQLDPMLHDAAVVELGMSHRGEIAQLCRVAEPEIGVVTNVAPVHLEFFTSVEEIALAKRELIEGLAGKDPVAVLNDDDERVSQFGKGFRGRVMTFGLNSNAEFRAEAIVERGVDGTEFDFISPNGRTNLKLPLSGVHNVRNALAALAAASVWGVTAEDARNVFTNLAPAEMRGEWIRFDAGFTVMNDSYNSNPMAMNAMVDVLAATQPARRRILIAGEMLELGPRAADLHRETGRYAAGKKVDWIFGVRGLAKEIVAGAVEAGHSARHTGFFGDSEESAQVIPGFVAEGDVVLIKGSRGVKMERIVAALMEKFPKHSAAAQQRAGH
ncbi:MAG: UDP-N-acetylmuramoyl-tripeptide--D-alanyl-D-alanine ligase [Acidobacteria bacterium]|nr:UDP-N-acetylmuramoyl-tripeptide--D-alanyl-D-alanine ligase [Acidobacteriota bacterium]